MTANDKPMNNNLIDEDEATLAASSDVVAKIRQQARDAKAQAADARPFDDDDLTGPARPPAEVPAAEAPVHATMPPLPPPMVEAPKVEAPKAEAPKVEAPKVESLIGDAPAPVPSTSFWDPTDRSPEVIQTMAAAGSGRRFPAWFWLVVIALVVLVIIAIALAFVAAGGSTST